MLEKVKKIIRDYNLLVPGDSVVVAVSGGADSVCLMRILSDLAGECRLKLLIAHMNHAMRGAESDRDEAFVRDLGRDLGIAVETKKMDIPALLKNAKMSPEDLCREERYRFLSEVCRKHQFTKIALGHTLNDRVETVLMNFLRGSGIEGLKGFSPCRGGLYIRPLFDVTRQEVLDFLLQSRISYVTDSSNASDDYLRNRLRNTLIPLLEAQYNPQLSANLITMSDILSLENDYMKSAAETVLRQCQFASDGNELRLDIGKFRACHPALQRRVAKMLLLKLTPAEKGIGFRHIGSVMNLVNGDNPSGTLDLPYGIQVRRDYELLIFAGKKGEGSAPENSFLYPVSIPGVLTLPQWNVTFRFELSEGPGQEAYGADPNRVYMDYDKISFPLAVRSMEPGDRIQPFGMIGRKKISDVLIDLKISRFRRSRLALLVDRDEVLWVPGIKLSEKVRTTPDTGKILKAEII